MEAVLMVKEFEVRWEGRLPAAPADVWDAITQHADGMFDAERVA
jgi:uncharacterized protein YndB with AHSA1/START domain